MPHQWSMTANTHGEPMTTPPNWRGHGGTQYNLSLTPLGIPAILHDKGVAYIHHLPSPRKSAMAQPARLTTPRRYVRFTDHLRQTFACRVHKVCIDAGFTCPNRDGRWPWAGASTATM